MNDLRFNAVDLYAAVSPLESNRHYILYQKALDRFNAARRAAAIESIKSVLFGHARRLLNLGAIPPGQVRGRHYGGIKCVSLNQICGSMNRTGDFDHHFHPLDDRLRDRWVSVAMAAKPGYPPAAGEPGAGGRLLLRRGRPSPRLGGACPGSDRH